LKIERWANIGLIELKNWTQNRLPSSRLPFSDSLVARSSHQYSIAEPQYRALSPHHLAASHDQTGEQCGLVGFHYIIVLGAALPFRQKIDSYATMELKVS